MWGRYAAYEPARIRLEAQTILGMTALANLLIGALLVLVAGRPQMARFPSRWSSAVAALPLANAILLTAYVFSEDSYRDDGTSRWDAYRTPGGALGPIFATSVASLLSCAAALAIAAFGARQRLFRASACVAGLASLTLVTATILHSA